MSEVTLMIRVIVRVAKAENFDEMEHRATQIVLHTLAARDAIREAEIIRMVEVRG